MTKRKISEAQSGFLSKETGIWVESGLITDVQREDILETYTVAKRLSTVTLSLGVSMIGIGVLSFITANWQVMPSWLKIVMIVGAYTGSVSAAYFLERSERKAVSGVFLLLSGFLLLGGLALISQIFHIRGSAEGLLMIWLLVYAPTFLLVRDISVYILYEIVAVLYLNIKYYLSLERRFLHSSGSDGVIFDPGTLISPIQPTLLALFIAGVAWRIWNEQRRSASGPEGSLIRKIFVGGSARRIFMSNFMILNWFVWICVMNSSGQTILPLIFGILAIGAVIRFAAWMLDAPDLDLQGLLCVGIAGFSLSFPSLWDVFRNYDRTFLPEAISSTAIICAYLAYRIIRRERWGGLGVFLFCAFLFRWYFDKFYGFMSKSIFFISGGVALLAIAYAYRKWSGGGRAGARVVASAGEIYEADGDD